MSVGKRLLWQNKHYADGQRAARVRRKAAQLQGAFSTSEIYEPPIDEFDEWTY